MKKHLLLAVSILTSALCLLASYISFGQYTVLLDFDSTNGSKPNYSTLISDGTFLYGMTLNGGTNNVGVIFKIKPDGTGDTVLLNFSGTTNGSTPLGSLISDGIFLYGMTNKGGTGTCTGGCGVIFKIKTDGTGFAKLLDFSNASNGAFPTGSLILDGNILYGMTPGGGANNFGTVFKIMTDGSGYSKLLDFAGSNGKWPYGSLISDGTFLYGMTYQGGTSGNYGILFKIMTDGTGYSKLHEFTGMPNGALPHGSLFSDGIFLYGMTQTGGTNKKWA